MKSAKSSLSYVDESQAKDNPRPFFMLHLLDFFLVFPTGLRVALFPESWCTT